MAGTTYEGFTADEQKAMKEHAKELKAAARRAGKAEKAAEEEAAVVEKIAGMRPEDRVLAERLHAVVKAAAPHLAPKLWYGMPAYAKDGKVLCWFQSAEKFKTRYATFGFSDVAALDEGTMWPAAFAITGLTPEGEARIAELVERAAR